jgi:hypothetical protein
MAKYALELRNETDKPQMNLDFFRNGSAGIVRFFADLLAPQVTKSNLSVVILSPQDEFDRQKAAFKQIPPLMLERYAGQYVASINGEIVDSDNNLATLARRFSATHGDADVYVSRVHGHSNPLVIRTPFLR